MDDLLLACELHDVDRLRAVLDGGLDPNGPVRGKRPMEWLLEMYTRSDRFPACVQVLLDRGAVLDDPELAPVLLDDATALRDQLVARPSLLQHRTTVASAFTPLVGATLLHVAAEFGHLDAARVLVEAGADVNARAAMDEHGLDGHTPIFHTVNAHANRSLPVMHLLLDAGADPQVRLPGLTWGRGFEWAAPRKRPEPLPGA